MTEQHHIAVDLGDRSYPIVIGSQLLGGGFDLSRYVTGSQCLIVSSETVAPLYLESLGKNLESRDVASIQLADGEQHKTLETVQQVFAMLVEMGAGRDITLIALGGGVVGDTTGFAAATWMRGVNFIQVPTTLLAQVDSSVGGKTGVNLPAGKNLVGAFYQPQMVMIDTDSLTTLPDREFRAGLAEVIKYGAIADAAFFEWLEASIPALLERDAATLAHAIRRSCELKAEVVAEDERESGRRAILNFGHTFGHAIERCQGYGEWLHGEAVAAGMIMAARLSGLPESDVDRLSALVEAAGLEAKPPTLPAAEMMAAMGMDKKVLNRRLRFVLLDRIGAARVSSEYDEARLTGILESAAA
ncbi:MAG: 3-dehydroquinate synthase [Pseudomonadota bacterium]